MKFLPLTVIVAEPDPKSPNPQEPEMLFKQQLINFNVAEIYFIFRKTLDPQTQIVANLPGPLFTSQPPSDSDLENVGFVSFDTVEGATAWCNPQQVQFYVTPELSTYVLHFPGGSRLSLKTTQEELRRKLGVDGGVIV